MRWCDHVESHGEVAIMQKLSINLLQAELIPEQPLWTLKRVVVVWGIALVLMISWGVTAHYQLESTERQLALLNQEKAKADAKLAGLEQRVAQNKADAVLQEKLATLKLLLQNKTMLHEQLTDASSTYAAGFSQAMTELSQLHHNDISLQQVKMNAEQLMFSGLAKTPEAVPEWLAAFETSTFLSGQFFRHFSLSENEQKVTQFTVSSSNEPNLVED